MKTKPYAKRVLALFFVSLLFLSTNAQVKKRVEYGALLELKGRIYTGAGQAGVCGFDGFENYWNIAPENRKPILFMDYYDTYNVRENWSYELKQELLKYHRQGYYVIPQIGLYLNYVYEDIINGKHEKELDNLIKGFEYLGMPCFLRIGYEYNNQKGWTAEEYKKMFRIITQKIRDADLEIATVLNAGLSGGSGAENFYPGDEYTDWVGYNTFGDIGDGNVLHSNAREMIELSLATKKPILIGEAAPNNVNGKDNSKDWSWYNIYFSQINAHSTIKQMCYINWDWDGQDMIAGNGWFPWGDARLQIPGAVKDKFFEQLSDPAYLGATTEKKTRALFFYDDNDAPNQVKNLRRVGDKLVWDAVTDNGEAGLAHYSVYKDGKFWDYISREDYPVVDLGYGYKTSIEITAMDRAGNESRPSAALEVNMEQTVEMLDDVEFDMPSTSLSIDWRFMGTMEDNGSVKPAPDDLTGNMDSTGKLSGQHCVRLEWFDDVPNPKDWKLQLFRLFQVEEGQEYEFRFMAVADEPTTCKLYFMDNHPNPLHEYIPSNNSQDPPWMDNDWEFYKIWTVEIGTEPQSYTFKAKAPATETARISFMFGNSHRTVVYMDSISVTAGLSDTEPLAYAGSNQVIIDTDDNGAEQVTLDGSESNDPDGSITSWIWKNSEGSQIAEGETATINLKTGEHILTLEVTDNDGNTSSDDVKITVTNGVPVADAGKDQLITDVDSDGKELVTLSGSKSYDPDLGEIVKYVWKEGDKIIAEGEKAERMMSEGIHNIVLEVTDNDGKEATDRVEITIVPNVAPGAVVTASSNEGSANNVIDLNESTAWQSAVSASPEWLVFDLDEPRDITRVDVLWGFDYAKEYKIQVSDDISFATYKDLSTTTEGKGGIEIYEASPVIKGQFVRLYCTKSSVGFTVFEDSSKDLQAEVTKSVANPTATFVPLTEGIAESFCYIDWWNNGVFKGSYSSPINTEYTFSGVTAGDSVRFKYKYSLTGGGQSYSNEFGFIVEEDLNGERYDVKQVKIYSVTADVGRPVANAGPDQKVADGDGNGVEGVILDGSASYDSDGSIESYVWKNNGQQISSGVSPTVKLPVGEHHITLTVTDNDGKQDTDAVKIVVEKAPSAPAVPTSLAAKAVSASEIELSWIDNADNEDGFKVYRDGSVVATLEVNATGYKDSGLLPETNYFYTVSAFNNVAEVKTDSVMATTLKEGDEPKCIEDETNYSYKVNQAEGSTSLEISFESKVNSSFVDLWIAVNGGGAQGMRGNQDGNTWTWTIAQAGGKTFADDDEVTFFFRYQHNFNPGQSDTPEGKFIIGKGCATLKSMTLTNEPFAEGIKIYPNPVKNKLFLSGIDKATEYSVLNLSGKSLMSGNGNNVDVSRLNSGIYLLKVNNKYIRFIKE